MSISRSGATTEAATRLVAVLLVLVGSCIFACLLAGCGDDGPNGPDNTGGPLPPADPEQAWQNLQWALDTHQAAGWTGTIGSGFAYIPDPVSAAKFPDAFADWGRDEELAFAQALFDAELDFDARMVANGAGCPAPAGSTVTWPGVEYALAVSGPDGGNPVTYRGVADLEFGLEGAFWYLLRWTDLHGAAAPWNGNVVCPASGELRAAYRASPSSN